MKTNDLISKFLKGKSVLEKVKSQYNGEIKVEDVWGSGISIRVDGIMQSGKLVREVWSETLNKFQEINKSIPNKILILGLGGGDLAWMLRKRFPDSKIVGVDIDLQIVEMGKKYLGLNPDTVEIIIDDAFEFVKKQKKEKQKFDLVCVDLYQGTEYPEIFDTDDFYENLKEISDWSIINRLYYGEKRPKAMKSLSRLEKMFEKIEVVHPTLKSNIVFVMKS